MSEVDEVARAIFDQHPEFFPMPNYAYALSVATGQMPEESLTIVEAVAEALMELSNEQRI